MTTATLEKKKNQLAFSRADVKKTVLYFLFFYPSLLSLVYPILTGSHINWREGLENFVFAALLIAISNLLLLYRLRLVYLTLTLLFIYLSVFIEAGYFYLYKNSISESTVFILLETNYSEASDFFSMYFDKLLFVLSLVLLLPLLLSFFLLVKLLPFYDTFLAPGLVNRKGNKYTWVWSLVLSLLLAAGIFQTSLCQRNILYISLKSWRSYQNEIRAYALLSNDKLGGKFTNVASGNQDEEVYVMIIGEATTRHHMSLYNYYRNTNPLLSAKKNDLIIYNNVISPHTHTILSLQKVLTLANYENPELFKDGSVLQLMNKAGFQTYWLSNQSPIGADETLVTKLAKAAGKTYFTNTASWTSVTPYDEKLWAPLEKVLSEKAKKKFIVIHLMGAHGKYFKRYPKTFAQFHDTPQTPFKHEKAYSFINQYDNAILYNDYVVSQIMDMIKKETKKSWLLYFSDHGEDVFETINTATHQDVGGTKAMYDIPFFLWLSDAYKRTDNHQYVPERKYMTDDLIYTIADLSDVHFKEFDSTRSLVNSHFADRKRTINKKDDYDEEFKNK